MFNSQACCSSQFSCVSRANARRKRKQLSVSGVSELLARRARHTDVIVIGQPDLTEAAFMDSGHPALVLPARRPGHPAAPAGRSSPGTARARPHAPRRDAIPLLQSAELVLVLVVDARDIGGRAGDRPGEALAAHLRRHEINAEVRLVPSGGASITDVLLAQVRDEAADLLVMGGYGHSRLREMLVGGTTRSILEHMTVPVLFAH